MTKIPKSFFLNVIEGLSHPVEPAAMEGVADVVGELPDEANVTIEDLDSLELTPELWSNVVFALLAKQYPDEVRSNAHHGTSIAEVFEALLGDARSELTNDKVEDIEVSSLPQFIQDFRARLHGEPIWRDDMEWRQGLEDVTIGFDDVDGNTVTLKVAEDTKSEGTIALRQKATAGGPSWRVTITLSAPKNWNVSCDLNDLDLPLLRRLHDALKPISASGTAHPLLRGVRAAQDRIEGGVFEAAIAALEATIGQQEQADVARGANVDLTLRKLLGNRRVRRGRKEDVDGVARQVSDD